MGREGGKDGYNSDHFFLLSTTYLLHHLGLCSNGILRNERGSNLLCDPSSLSILHICVPYLVQDLCLTCVHVPQNTHYRRSEEVQRHFLLVTFPTDLEGERLSE